MNISYVHELLILFL